MLTATVKSLWSRKRRLLGASTAVVIGVAFLVATLILGDSMRTGFATFFADSNKGIDLFIRNGTEVGSDDYVQKGTLDEALVDMLAVQPGVERVAANIEGTAQIVATDGTPIGGEGPPTLGGNWIDDTGVSGPGFNGYSITEGRAPAADNEVVIDRGSAKEGKLHIGDTTTVLTPEPVKVDVVGIVAFGSDDNIGGASYTGFTFGAAQQHLLGQAGRITSILVAADDGVTPEQLRTALIPVLPTDSETLTGAERTEEEKQALNDDFLGFFEAFLLAFAVVALLVATFSIHNTFSILVAQRTRESALLRALGASRRQVLIAVGGEALALSFIASAIGIGAGVGLAAGLKALMDAAGFGLPSAIGLEIETATMVTGMVVGIAVTLVATIAPAIKATRIAPLAAMRDVAVDRSGASKARAILGLLVTAAGVATVFTATRTPDDALATAGLGALVTMIGAVILGPVVATLATSVLGAPVAVLRGHAGSLARRNAMRNPRRSAGTASALMFGTAVVALFATFGSSMKASFEGLVDDSFAGDLVVAQNGFSGSPLPEEMTPAIAALAEVEIAAALANAPIVLDGNDEIATAADPEPFAAAGDLDVIAGSLASMTANGVAVSEAYAGDHGWTIGTVVPVAFADGSTDQLSVEAIYSRRNIVGDVIITDEIWQPHQGRSGDSAILVSLASGVRSADGKAAVQAVSDRFHGPDVQDRNEFANSISEDVDQMLGLIYGLLGLAILIAVLGIANTLSLSIHERTRELGLLRAVGQSRRQLRSTVRWESVIIAIFGTVGGIALGTFLGWGIVRAMLAQEGIGIFEAPIATLVAVLGLAMVAGIVAAVRPARRAAKLDILQAIATT
jgi:putative ABC transport system permease protein